MRGELQQAFAAQQRAFARDRAPDLAERLERVSRLRRMVIDRRQAFQTALAEDFGTHHPWLVDLMETGPVLARANHFLAQLPHWLADTEVDLGPAHGSSRGQILYLPKGVMGNIAPWNFAIESALVMTIDMLAAGNRVMIKPSELAPATADAVAAAVAAHFEPDLMTVITGGPELAQAFADMAWDHLTFTGSGRIGRMVAQAAARRMTPVTLELGGKNPALFAPDGVTEALVTRFLSFRTLKSGQVCTAPDHVLVPADRMEDWISLAKAVWRAAYPAYVGSDQCVGIINQAHFDRLRGYLAEAERRGVRIERLNDDVADPARRHFPLTLIIDPPADLACMTDEVFGPVVPVVPYQTMAQAIDGINAGETPLGTYIATHDTAVAEHFIRQVRSGGAAVNNFGLQGGHVALPFGGLGASGQGCHSAWHGFLNYSHPKSVFWGAEDSMVHKVLEPPLGALTAMAAAGQYESV